MTNTENIYRSILLKIGTLPVEYLQQVDVYLQLMLQKSMREKQANRINILALAGCWDDMSEASFNEYLDEAKNTGANMFQDRAIENNMVLVTNNTRHFKDIPGLKTDNWSVEE